MDGKVVELGNVKPVGPREGVLMRPEDAFDLARLRQLEFDLERPVLEWARELVYLRQVEAEARDAMRKVAQHEETGWERIRLGAFDRLRAKLAERRPW